MPLLEYHAPIALFRQESSRLVRDRDERLVPRRRVPVNTTFEGIYLTDYIGRKLRIFQPRDFEHLLSQSGIMAVPAIATVLSAQWLERYPRDPNARYYAAKAALGMGDTTRAKMMVDEIPPASAKDARFIELAADVEIRLALSPDLTESDRAYAAARTHLLQLARLPDMDRVATLLKLGDLTYSRSTAESVGYYAQAVKEAKRPEQFRSDDSARLANAAVAAWQLGNSSAADDLLKTAGLLDAAEPAVKAAGILIHPESGPESGNAAQTGSGTSGG